jgi:hypothetical protein
MLQTNALGAKPMIKVARGSSHKSSQGSDVPSSAGSRRNIHNARKNTADVWGQHLPPSKQDRWQADELDRSPETAQKARQLVRRVVDNRDSSITGAPQGDSRFLHPLTFQSHRAQQSIADDTASNGTGSESSIKSSSPRKTSSGPEGTARKPKSRGSAARQISAPPPLPAGQEGFLARMGQLRNRSSPASIMGGARSMGNLAAIASEVGGSVSRVQRV